jgi:hypothetical protein
VYKRENNFYLKPFLLLKITFFVVVGFELRACSSQADAVPLEPHFQPYFVF